MTRTLQTSIQERKQQTDTVILAHTYQPPEILAVADVVGDSFALAKAASSLHASRVLVCGVRFMAQTVKILAPEKTVLLASPLADCPMAHQISPQRVREFKIENPDIPVVAYINTTAELKAQCDICVTSSSAVKIVRALQAETLLFIPDQNLGAWVQQQVPEKVLLLWDGCCPVHGRLSEGDVLNAKLAHPGAKLTMHPECPPQTLSYADHVGSTQEILAYVRSGDFPVIVGTERGVVDSLLLEFPGREIYQLQAQTLTCPDMKMTSLADVDAFFRGDGGIEITMEEPLRLAAKRSIDAMLHYGG